MKMKKHLILSMLLLGFAGMLEAENVQRTLPDVVEGRTKSFYGGSTPY
jgi:hypothetical protein